MARASAQPKKGRPRAFDVDRALDRAMRVFWRHGYEGASLAELTEAMGINRPSLYAAFGDKETLFRQAVARYTEQHASQFADALRERHSRDVVARLWRSGIALVACRTNPRGCMLIQGALACGDSARSLQRELARQRSTAEGMLRSRFEQAIIEGDLPSSTDAASLARFVTTINYGMAIHAADGASPEELEQIVRVALEAWPKRPARRTQTTSERKRSP